jgi:AcrR family transcriptional regulator
MDAAGDLMNAGADAPLTLPALAEALGVHHTSIYHYFASVHDLRAEVMMRACRTRATLLATAQGADGMQRVLAFVASDIRGSGLVRLENVEVLPDAQRDRVRAAIEDNVTALARRLEDGVRDASIRRCDAELSARTVLDLLDRLVAADPRDAGPAGSPDDGIVAAAQRLLAGGLLSPRFGALPELRQRARLPDLAVPVDGGADGRLDLILRTLTAEVRRRGAAATSIPDVAASIGMSKTSFYRYAADKEELLFLCALRTQRLVHAATSVVEALGGDAVESLLLLAWYIGAIDRSPAGPLTHGEVSPSLAPHHRSVVANANRTQWRRIDRIVSRATAAGDLVPLPPRIVHALVATLMRVMRWCPDLAADGAAADATFRQVAGVLLLGLAPRR